MSKTTKPLWLGPATLFVGFLTLFGSIGFDPMTDQDYFDRINYARTMVVIFGAFLTFAGAKWTFAKGDDE